MCKSGMKMFVFNGLIIFLIPNSTTQPFNGTMAIHMYNHSTHNEFIYFENTYNT